MIFVALLLALPMLADEARPLSAARCKKTFSAGSASQFVGRATWQDEAQNTIVGSTEERSVGQSVLTCSVKLSGKATSAVLDFGGARIGFEGKEAAGGLEITATGGNGKAQPVCTISGIRISRENWMELGPASYTLPFGSPVDRVTLTFTLIDASAVAAIRADINPIVIRPQRPGETVLPCPPAVR